MPQLNRLLSACTSATLLLFSAGLPHSFAQTLPDYLPTDGLVGWWPLDGNGQDVSGNGHHGIEVNTGLGVNRFGQSAGALQFFGNSVVWGDCSGFPQLNQTVSVWFSSTDLDQGPSGRSVLGYGGSSCGDSWLMLLDNNLGIPSGNGEDAFNLQGHCNNDERLLPYDVDLLLSQWTNWTVVNAAEGVRFFVNGVRSDVGPAFDGFGSGVFTEGRSFNFGMSSSTYGSAGYYDVAATAFVGMLDDIGIWNRALTDAEVMALYLGEPPMWGCTDSTACNFNPEANADDGSCVPSGCLDAAACNFNAAAGCAGVACDFTCCPGPGCCGDGMVWDVAAQTCTIDPDFVTGAIDAAVAEALDGVCGPGTVWDSTLGMCTGAGPTGTCASDLNGNGAVEIQDLLILLSDYETLCPVPEPVASACGDLTSVNFDGYSYPLVAIGSQCWFKENLRSDNYRNGDPIPGGLSDAEWTSTTAGAQSPYYNDEQNLGASGRLYNGAAVSDSRGLCPVGFHVPTDTDWINLELALGMSMQEANSTGWRGTDQGMQLKSAAMDSPSWNGTNVSGFSAVAGGYRDGNSGVFINHGDYGYWWTASLSSANAWYRILSSGNTFVYRFYSSLSDGFSVRCLQD